MNSEIMVKKKNEENIFGNYLINYFKKFVLYIDIVSYIRNVLCKNYKD